MEVTSAEKYFMANGHKHDNTVYAQGTVEEAEEIYRELENHSFTGREINVDTWKSEDEPVNHIDLYAYWADQFEQSDEFELESIIEYRFKQPNPVEARATELVYEKWGRDKSFLTNPSYIVESRNEDSEVQMVLIGNNQSKSIFEKLAKNQ